MLCLSRGTLQLHLVLVYDGVFAPHDDLTHDRKEHVCSWSKDLAGIEEKVPEEATEHHGADGGRDFLAGEAGSLEEIVGKYAYGTSKGVVGAVCCTVKQGAKAYAEDHKTDVAAG